jgi:AP-1-like transcription factor
MMNYKEDADKPQSRPILSKKDNLEGSKDQIRRHAPSSAPSEEHPKLFAHEDRRRAQNRASQRAFRERKKHHAESLQQQVREMQKTHNELLRSYSQKEEEVLELHDKIHDLEHKIRLLNASSPGSQSSQTSASFQLEHVVFDDSYDRWPAANFQIPISWDGRVQPMDESFVFPSLYGCF